MVFSEEQKKIIQRIEIEFSKDGNIGDLIPDKLPMQLEMQDLYSLDEVAKILGKSLVTIRQYVRDGKLNAIKQWRNWMVSSNEIARQLYERQIGIKLKKGTPILAVIKGADLYSNESQIEGYHLITHEDIFKIVDDASFSQREMWDKLARLFLPSFHSVDWIEAVSNIPHFFRRTKDLPFQDEDNDTTSIAVVFDQVTLNTIDTITPSKVVIDELLEQTPREAIQTIINHFGVSETDEKLTPAITLKLYKAFLELAKENVRLKDVISEGGKDDE